VATAEVTLKIRAPACEGSDGGGASSGGGGGSTSSGGASYGGGGASASGAASLLSISSLREIAREDEDGEGELLASLPVYKPLMLTIDAYSKVKEVSRHALQSALERAETNKEALVGKEKFGHGEDGALPYLNVRYNLTRQDTGGMGIDINCICPTQRFPKRNIERTIEVLLHHRARVSWQNKFSFTPLDTARGEHKECLDKTSEGGSGDHLTSTVPSAAGAHVLMDPPWHYPKPELEGAAGRPPGQGSKHKERYFCHHGHGLLDALKANWSDVVDKLAEFKATEDKEEAELKSMSPAAEGSTPQDASPLPPASS